MKDVEHVKSVRIEWLCLQSLELLPRRRVAAFLGLKEIRSCRGRGGRESEGVKSLSALRDDLQTEIAEPDRPRKVGIGEGAGKKRARKGKVNVFLIGC